MNFYRFSYDKLVQILIILMPISIMIGRGVADVFATSIGLLFIARCIYKKDSSILFEDWVKCALLLWVYSMIRSLFTEDLLYSFSKTIPWARFIFFAAAIQYYLMKDPRRIKNLLITTSFAAVFLTLDSLFQYVVGKDIFGKPYYDEGDYIRLTGPYSKMFVGYIITSLSLPFISYLIFKMSWSSDHNSKIKSVFFVIIITLIYGAVFLSGERSALIEITVGIAMIFFAARINPGALVKISIGLTTAVFASYLLMPQEFQRQFLTVYHTARNFDESTYGMLWNAGIRLGFNNIFLGVGPSNYELECAKLSIFCRQHPHNIFIEWFAEYGIIGLGLFTYFIFTILLDVKKFYLGIEKKYYKYILIGLLSTLVIKLLPLPSSGFFKNWYAVPFWYIIGWMTSFKNPNYTPKKFKH